MHTVSSIRGNQTISPTTDFSRFDDSAFETAARDPMKFSMPNAAMIAQQPRRVVVASESISPRRRIFSLWAILETYFLRSEGRSRVLPEREEHEEQQDRNGGR